MMKKIMFIVSLFLALVVSGAFAQTTADEWFKKAEEYYDIGNYANAITAYGEAIKRDSSLLDAYWGRNFAYYQVKNYDAAIADCNTVIKSVPNFSYVYVSRGDAYGAKDIYHKAVADYKNGLELGFDPSKFHVDKTSKADMWFCGAMYIESLNNALVMRIIGR